MIEIDRTDEEREELVKQWIKDYWKTVVGAVVLAIIFVAGINYFRQAKIAGLRESAAEMDSAMALVTDKKLADAQKGVAALQDDKADTSFPALATLSLAKGYFDKGDYTNAITQYNWLIENVGDIAMRDIARLRKARAQSNAKQYDKAVDTLAGLENTGSITEANLLKGDIYLASEQYEKAKQAYDSIKDEAKIKPLIEQRLNLLTIKQQQPK